MRLEDLFTNFNDLSGIEQQEFMEKYAHKRQEDFERSVTVKPKGTKKAGKKTVKVTLEQFDLLKKLGLV